MIQKMLLFLFPILILSTSCFGKTNQNASIAQNTSNQSATQEYKVIFVELGSVNCVPCKMMRVVMDQIEQEYSNQVKVVFYDVWTPEGKPYGEYYKIRAIPTQVFLDKKGREFFRHEGYFPKEELVKILKKQGVK